MGIFYQDYYPGQEGLFLKEKVACNSLKWGESGERIAMGRKKKSAFRLFENLEALDFIMVPEVGIEPTCPCERGILSPLRLPVSPLRHGRDYIGE
jgi:hypothetical protein